MNLIIPSIPNATTVADLRLAIANAFTVIQQQLNNQTQTTTYDMNNYRIVNLGLPVTPNDAATKAYVDKQVGSSVSAAVGGPQLSTTTIITTLAVQITYEQ